MPISHKNRKIILLIFVLLFLYLIAFPSISPRWTGKVVSVTDGDIIKVMHEGKSEKIRLYGIDCPEKAQAFGKRAKKFTSKMVFGKTVEVESIAKDRNKRTIGIVTIDGTTLNEALIKAGYAWVYNRYCKKPICRKWNKLHKEAQKNRLGLWQDPEPMAPWKWRRQKREK